MHKLYAYIKKYIFVLIVFGTISAAALVLAISGISFLSFPGHTGAAAVAVSSPFTYTFAIADKLSESGSMSNTTSPYWWVNSGGYLVLKDGMGMTTQGTLPATDPWRKTYARANPVDTDSGTHPQNIFRLVTRSSWDNVREEASFFINKDNFSTSPNRNASNGLLLMSRYGDAGQTLYYAGIRVDGTAVIKKKYKGVYYTMAQEKIFPGTYTGTRDSKNLIPHGTWIALRSDTVTNEGGTVTVSLWMKREDGTWEKLLSITDTGKNYGGTPPIAGPGYAGIRTDFMDVKFENFKLENI